MYIKFIEQFSGNPEIVIAPQEPHGIDGVIFVRPLHLDLDSGKYVLRPTVDAHVSLGGRMTPELADQWGECLREAAAIASRKMLPWSKNSDAFKMWDRVDEIIARMTR